MKAKKHCVRNVQKKVASEDAEREAIREYRKKMLICSCARPCVYSPPACPAAQTSSLLELNRMFALLKEKPALSKEAETLRMMAKFELTWQPLWEAATLRSAVACPLLELTIAAEPVLSAYLRQQHKELLSYELGQLSMPKSAVLVMGDGVEVPVLEGYDKIVVDVDKCDELADKLTQKAVRRVLLILPFATEAKRQAEWQSVINCVPISTSVLLCPAAPQRVVDQRHIDEYQRLMGGLHRVYGKVEWIGTPKLVLQEHSRNTLGVVVGDEYSTRVYWSTVDCFLGKRREPWQRMFEALSEEDEKRVEAAVKQQECQQAQTEAQNTKNKQSGTMWVSVKKTLKNLFHAENK